MDSAERQNNAPKISQDTVQTTGEVKAEYRSPNPGTGCPQGTPPCPDEQCLLFDTPPVGVFPLEPRSMEDSLLGRTEAGKRYKLGKGKVSVGNVKAARDLLAREFPQVTS